MQLLACVSEALRAICIKRTQAARPQGFNSAELLILLALPSSIMLLGMSAIFEAPAALHAVPRLVSDHLGLAVLTAGSSILTDLTCYLALAVCTRRSEYHPHNVLCLACAHACSLEACWVHMLSSAGIFEPKLV